MITLPAQVNTAIGLLEKSGFEAYAVGGCVRDLIMGRKPYDYDITTNALPDRMKEIFSDFRCIETGIKHGTLTVIIDKMPLEITTYRIDGEYKDSRHPDSVSFSENLKDDLSRRDFTVNTLCFNERSGLIDCFGGLKDIENKTIRCVGEPDKRFNEDALRILRAVRFSCTLGFSVEEETAKSVLTNRELIKNIAIERVREEFTKLICADRVFDVLNRFREVIGVFIPEYSPLSECEQNTPYHIYNVFEHSLRALEEIDNDEVLRLTMFFHDIAKPVCKKTDEFGVDHFKGHAALGSEMTREILKRMKYPNSVTDKVCSLIAIHSEPCPKTKEDAKKFLLINGEEFYEAFMKVRRADCLAKAQPHAQDEKLKNMQLFLDEIRENYECYSLKQLKIDGNDLKEVGIRNGLDIKRILDILLNDVIYSRCENEKDVLLKRAKEIFTV